MNKKDKISGIVTLILIVLVLLFRTEIQNEANQILIRAGLKEPPSQNHSYAGISAQLFKYDEMIASGEILAYAPELSEDNVYTFLQGPKSWTKGITWSGEWCMEYAKGQYFGSFGCGFCCIANLYSTFSDYECSPLDVYEYAMEVTGYAPARKNAAIDWGNMKVLLQKMGFQCDVYYKPASYEEFQEQIKNCKSAVVLVCSANDDTFWKNIPGHYVTISLYDETTDEVFLGEPGSPTKNRTRVQLRYIYDALKTTSKFQYLMVDSYSDDQNQWKHDGIDDQWVAP
ncbi:MAG: chaperonin [Lachnospiraceae bacterium]|nr:chaperonin [Lachnospiraceae bacterium]